MRQLTRPTGRAPGRGVRAFTLIECLIIISLIGFLISLLMPAVQAARQAADRLDCANRLRQVALALHQSHDTRNTFPPGLRSAAFVADFPSMSWRVRILPYLEQEAAWRVAEADYRTLGASSYWSRHRLMARVDRAWICPADPLSDRPHRIERFNCDVALSNWLGSAGTHSAARNGVLFRDSVVRIVSIRDGTSNTLLVGERGAPADAILGWWYGGTGVAVTGGGDAVLGSRERNFAGHLRGCPRGPYRFQEGSEEPCHELHFWSHHPGGAHFALADGSVRFLNYDADAVLPALSTRAGGEATQTP